MKHLPGLFIVVAMGQDLLIRLVYSLWNGGDDSEKLLLGKTSMSFKLWEVTRTDMSNFNAIQTFQNLNLRSIINALSVPKIIELFYLLFGDQSDLNINRLGFSFVLSHQLNRCCARIGRQWKC